VAEMTKVVRDRIECHEYLKSELKKILCPLIVSSETFTPLGGIMMKIRRDYLILDLVENPDLLYSYPDNGFLDSESLDWEEFKNKTISSNLQTKMLLAEKSWIHALFRQSL